MNKEHVSEWQILNLRNFYIKSLIKILDFIVVNNCISESSGLFEENVWI